MTALSAVQYVAIGFCMLCVTWAIIGFLKKIMRSDEIISGKVPVLGNKGKILLRLSPTVVYRVEYNNIVELAMILNLIQKEQTRPVKYLGRD